MQNSLYLIDWLTLRFPLGQELGQALSDKVRSCLDRVMCCDAEGEMKWESRKLDIDALRSDSAGLFWMVQGDGKHDYLTIGASPASIEHGVNVFGSCDIQHCAAVLVKEASKQLAAILPHPSKWQCRRIDITGNFVLPDASSVKQALRQLCLADGGRRKASNGRAGDTVYWNASSDLVKGKAYHKGPHLAHLCRKGKVDLSEDLLALADRVLRLEHTRGARWFRRLAESGRSWFALTCQELEAFFVEFFGRVVDGVEVKDMDRMELVKLIEVNSATTPGRALAAFNSYVNIRTYGFEVMKESMPRATWQKHLRMLRAAGISDADLQQGNVVQFRPVKIVLAQPVMSWDEIRRAA